MFVAHMNSKIWNIFPQISAEQNDWNLWNLSSQNLIEKFPYTLSFLTVVALEHDRPKYFFTDINILSLIQISTSYALIVVNFLIFYYNLSIYFPFILHFHERIHIFTIHE